MQLKRIGPMSLARLAAGLYAAIGLFIGLIFALAAMVGAGFAGAASDSSPLLGLVFGVGAMTLE
jgi:Na+-transporting NADH:ubiquinone oxidoreductase subunit NqrE